MLTHILKRRPESYYFGTAVALDFSVWEHDVLVYGTLNSELSDYVRFFRLLMALSEM